MNTDLETYDKTNNNFNEKKQLTNDVQEIKLISDSNETGIGSSLESNIGSGNCVRCGGVSDNSGYDYNRNKHRNSIGTYLSVNYLQEKQNNNETFLNKNRKIASTPAKPSQYIQNRQKLRRFSQDSGIVTGRDVNTINNNNNNSDPSLSLRRSTDNIRFLQFYQNPDNQKLTITTSLHEEDDNIESPVLGESSQSWLNTSQMTLLPKINNDKPQKSSPTCHKAFGPRIGVENIPGTPMIGLDLIQDDSNDLNIEMNSSSILSDNIALKKSTDDNKPPSTYQNETTDSSTNISYTSRGQNNWESVSRRVSKQDKEGLDPESLMFRDGRRKIDMVLAWEEEDHGVMTETEARQREQRKIFQENLKKEGLELELEDKSQAFDEKTFFLKIHLPWKLETRFAEVLNLKLPIKRFITISVNAWDDNKPLAKKIRIWKALLAKYRNMIQLSGPFSDEEASFKRATAGGNPEEQFIVKDRCTSYTSAQRSLIVMQILLRTKYDDTEKCGIRRLLNEGVYLACFPLHEGRYDRAHSSGVLYDRRILYLNWARPSQWYKKQPLCLVRKYFGDKIALYFCWLGFYTEMLFYPAVVGFLCFLYGLASMDSDDNTPSKEICDESGVGNITLCPLCDTACSYQSLHDSCIFAKLTYLFDNPSTVFFAIFMSFWATTFLELWKRKQSVIVWEWDLQNVEADEEPRPEFETSAKTFRINPVTREKEPYMSTWSRSWRFVITGSAVCFMIAVVLGAVLGTIIYRISLVSVIYGSGGLFVKKHTKIFTTITAALINLTIIMILTKLYHRLAIRLTNLENPRTHTEYEDSYTFKIFFFEFMNFYSSLIYIAFFKGRFYDYPGDEVARQSDFFRLKNDICDPAGCLSELCIQLAIIMVGKQFWNNFMEYLYPKFYNWWRQRKHKKATKDETHLHMTWEEDYHLQDPGRLALFDEYLEMIIQYGFVTLFVAAFPLAPLFALLNNIVEIRLDAYKMVTQARRPLADRVEDIGAWFGILKIITYTAVVSNAFVIAYTSDFIPRMVYKYVYSEHHDLVGYIDHSLSVFNTSDYKDEWGATTKERDPDTCQYRGYRNGPDNPEPYGLSPHYWHVFAARLAFVVVFEHIVFVVTGIMQFVIPDIPAEVRTQIQREQLLAKEAKYQHGLRKSQQEEYHDLMNILNDQNTSRVGNRGSWARRLSRVSNGLDAHVEVSNRKRKSQESTVWEDT